MLTICLDSQACLQAEVMSLEAGGGGLLGSLPTAAPLITSCVLLDMPEGQEKISAQGCDMFPKC